MKKNVLTSIVLAGITAISNQTEARPKSDPLQPSVYAPQIVKVGKEILKCLADHYELYEKAEIYCISYNDLKDQQCKKIQNPQAFIFPVYDDYGYSGTIFLEERENVYDVTYNLGGQTANHVITVAYKKDPKIPLEKFINQSDKENIFYVDDIGVNGIPYRDSYSDLFNDGKYSYGDNKYYTANNKLEPKGDPSKAIKDKFSKTHLEILQKANNKCKAELKRRKEIIASIKPKR
jgi:hypothetical protein